MSEVLQGVVIKSTGSWYTIRSEDGTNYESRLKGKFRIKGIRATNPIAVGDVVSFSIQEGGNEGNILDILPRKNHIIRRATKLSKATHIIASNIDQAVLIVSLHKPRTSTGFIDRFLSTAEAYHIPGVIVFNKIDLYNEEHKQHLSYYYQTYEKLGYKCLQTSVTEAVNLEDFASLIQDKVSLLAGHSGVGKSALVNAVNPGLNLKVGEISDYHQKGKHTTTFAEMFPLEHGGYIVDTPGIKEFGLVSFEKEELGQRFPEMRSRMQHCRFNNCLHVDEPQCEVLKAVEAEEIAAFRYMNYLNMLEELLVKDR